MQAFRDIPIKRKLTVAVLGTTLIVLIAACAAFLAYQRVDFRKMMVRNNNVLGDALALNCTAAITFANPEDAAETLQALSVKSAIVAACLYKADGVIFATYSRGGAPVKVPSQPEPDGVRFTPDYLAVVRPVMLNGQRIGTLYLRSDLTDLNEHLSNHALISGAVIFGSLILASVLSVGLQRIITRPILALTDKAKEIAHTRDYTARATKHGADEIGMLTEGLNQMLTGIQERDNALKTANEALHEENAERKDAEAAVLQLNTTLERRVAERTEELMAANKELEAFSYSVSHDLRAPLRAVDGYSRMMAEDYAGKLDEDGLRMLDVIRSETRRMGRLIDDLLAFSRLGRQQIEHVKIAMQSMAQEIFEEQVAQDPTRNVRLNLHPLPPAYGSEAMIRQVWVNLISNAVKFTKGREVGEIEIGALEGEDGKQVYFVKDNGAGFDMRFSDKLFGVFQRLHSEQEFAGTGVGLALVQRIVHRHGGRAWAEGAVDQGATFYFAIQNPKP